MAETTVYIPDDKLVCDGVQYEPIPGGYRQVGYRDFYWDGFNILIWETMDLSTQKYITLRPIKLAGEAWLNSLAARLTQGVFQLNGFLYSCWSDNDGWWWLRDCYRHNGLWYKTSSGSFTGGIAMFKSASDDTVTWLHGPYTKDTAK